MDDEITRLAAEIESNLQVVRQTDEAIGAYLDGWLSEDAYSAAIALRGACRGEVARLCAEIERKGGTPPVEPPSRDGYPISDRLSVTDDALAELSGVLSDGADTAQVNADAIAELSELVSSLMGGGE